MLGVTYYHETIRKYVAAFGTLFNDIKIQRKNSAGAVIEQISVPLAYGPKEKWLLRLRRGAQTGQQVAIQLPRLGFDIQAIAYDPTRKLNTIGKRYAANTSTTNSTLLKQFNPVPWNFDFNLYVMVKNSEDAAQILEQILPFFTPEFTFTLNLVPDMGLKPDITVFLTAADVDDNYETDFTEIRRIIWTLSFTLKGFIYPDIKSGTVIKTVEINFRVPTTAAATEPAEYIILEDSTLTTTNYILFNADAGSPSSNGVMKVVSESSPEGSGAAGIKSRITVAPSNLSISANNDFGFSEGNVDRTLEHFADSIDNDPATGEDTQL